MRFIEDSLCKVGRNKFGGLERTVNVRQRGDTRMLSETLYSNLCEKLYGLGKKKTIKLVTFCFLVKETEQNFRIKHHHSVRSLLFYYINDVFL